MEVYIHKPTIMRVVWLNKTSRCLLINNLSTYIYFISLKSKKSQGVTLIILSVIQTIRLINRLQTATSVHSYSRGENNS